MLRRRYPIDMANMLFADGYAVVGLKVGHCTAKNWPWFVDGRNLIDRKYAAPTNVTRTQAGADGHNSFPATAGRSTQAFNGKYELLERSRADRRDPARRGGLCAR
jgi:iron complex outermembrane receptor protein